MFVHHIEAQTHNFLNMKEIRNRDKEVKIQRRGVRKKRSEEVKGVNFE